MVIGNNLYSSIRCSVRTNDYLLLTDVPDMVSIFDKVYSIQYSESFTGSLFMSSNSGTYMSLRNSLLEVFSNSRRNYTCCLLTVGINTVAVFKNSEQNFKIFDSHLKDLYGMPDSFGRCTLVSIVGLEKCCIMGAIHSTKISGNFGLKLNGSVQPNWKSFEKISPPFEVDHFSRLDRSDRNGPFHLTIPTHSQSQYLTDRYFP